MHLTCTDLSVDKIKEVLKEVGERLGGSFIDDGCRSKSDSFRHDTTLVCVTPGAGGGHREHFGAAGGPAQGRHGLGGVRGA